MQEKRLPTATNCHYFLILQAAGINLADMHGHDREDKSQGDLTFDAAGDSQALPPCPLPLHLSLAAEDDHEEEGHADSQPCILSLPDRPVIPAISAPRPAMCSSEQHTAVTPELNAGCMIISNNHQEDAKSDESVSVNPQAARMFNIFVPKCQQRVCACILTNIMSTF
jgi:hypothetical protein